jgi:hypothetical protein
MKPDGQRPEKNMINVVPEESVHSARYGFHMLPVEPETCISSRKSCGTSYAQDWHARIAVFDTVILLV